MKITGQPPVNPFKIYQASQASQEKKEIRSYAGDKVELSAQAQKVRELARAVEELPEVREALIAEIKKQLADQTYRVAPEHLAQKILDALRAEKE
ncbi:MAG: flagellar biosynthesis anti-sigma factor FlgM [Clostridia bacterium]|jgi:flagellar biosynthesis anti-sigma factor FlgM|nr:flagellar biosynthesis anti-sigma factor FlgM [Clostridia bacterium]